MLVAGSSLRLVSPAGGDLPQRCFRPQLILPSTINRWIGHLQLTLILAFVISLILSVRKVRRLLFQTFWRQIAQKLIAFCARSLSISVLVSAEVRRHDQIAALAYYSARSFDEIRSFLFVARVLRPAQAVTYLLRPVHRFRSDALGFFRCLLRVLACMISVRRECNIRDFIL